jgi:hypothetical protein
MSANSSMCLDALIERRINAWSQESKKYIYLMEQNISDQTLERIPGL